MSERGWQRPSAASEALRGADDRATRDLVRAFRELGMRRGDVVLSHSSIGFFDFARGTADLERVARPVYDAFAEVLGPEGTLVVPTFTYSFGRREPFDVASAPSTCGLFTEWLRRRPEARRSRDPMFAVSAVGAKAEGLTSGAPIECFGPDSVWDRLLGEGALICNLNLLPRSTFMHYVERRLRVPYRYDKLFTGHFSDDGKLTPGAAIHFVYDESNPRTAVAFEPLAQLVRQRGISRELPAAGGSVVAFRAAAFMELITSALAEAPWLLTQAHADPEPPRLFRVPELKEVPRFRKDATAWEVLEGIWDLRRDLISDGYDQALRGLADLLPTMRVHEYPTGTHAWTWIVPERWSCREASLRRTDGSVVFSDRDHPLHVASYSLPFRGRVTRNELFRHLHTHPRLPAATPFVYKYYWRDWALCCSSEVREALTDDLYDVVIDTSFSRGLLKVGDVVVPGRTERTVMLAAHLCHPAMANDDAAGVAVAVEVVRRLLQRPPGRYTYRLTIVPETIGTVAFLSHNEQLLKDLVGGLFLEMLALPNPPALQLSLSGTTQLDKLWSLVLRDRDPSAWVGPFLRVVTNDERQYNAVNVGVPMLSLSRVLPPEEPDHPYAEYHSDQDSLAICSQEAVRHSVDLVIELLDALERNVVPRPRFKGEVFLSRYGLSVDQHTDVMFLMDGQRTIADIAIAAGITFERAGRLVSDFERSGLVEVDHGAERNAGRAGMPRD